VLEEFQINGIPTLILFKDGRRRSQFVDIPDRDGKNVLAWLKAELT
jgi:thioredoxin-like negative regulator of GroEL